MSAFAHANPTFLIAYGSEFQCRWKINAQGISFVWRTESHVLYVYYTDMHERVWILTHTRIKIGWRKRRRICTTYPFVTYIRIPSPYTARLSICLLERTEIKSLELRPEGACYPTWYRCLNKTTMWKGTFSELGSAQRCHRLGYEKYNFSRKRSVFQVLMEKITQCSGL